MVEARPRTPLPLSRDEMLARFRARDGASATLFVVGVVTTGIYCLPTCPARRPRPENVRFFSSVDEARASGLRACKRCRPDAFHAGRDPEREAVEALVALVERVRRDPGAFRDVGSMARAAGMGSTKLGASIRDHYHTTPREILLDARLTRAREQLLASPRRALTIALDAGFESLSAFHENFRRATGMAPGDYRRMGRSGAFALALPANYPHGVTLRMLGRDPEATTERVAGTRVVRALRLTRGVARLEFDLGEREARGRVVARRRLTPADMGEAHGALCRLLGLAIDPAPFERRARTNPLIRRLVRGRLGLRIPQTPDVWEGLVWSIVGQQVNVAFATTCRARLVELCGPRAGEGLRAHPGPAAVAKLDYADLTRLQYSRRKAEYVIDLARRVVAGELSPETLPRCSPTEVSDRLLAIRGLGPWSTQYVMMRSCGFGDCVPVGDSALNQSLLEFYGLDARPDPEETMRLMEPFAPHRSLASFHLWRRLGDPA